GEDLPTRQLDLGPRPADLVLEADHGGRAGFRPRRPAHLVGVVDYFRLLAGREPERPWQVADVERLVVLVQHEHDAVHLVPDGTGLRIRCSWLGGGRGTAPRAGP